MDSYEPVRQEERQGVRLLPPDERRASLVGIHRSESIDAIEIDSEKIRLQRAETNQTSADEQALTMISSDPPGCDQNRLSRLATEFDADSSFGVTDMW